MSQEWIINSIVFKEKLTQGVSQLDLLEFASSLGIGCFEIRREYLTYPRRELIIIKERAEDLGIKLFYSVNEDFFTNHGLNPYLEQFVEETLLLDAPFLKMNIGYFEPLSEENRIQLRDLCQEGFKISLENNQDMHNASIPNCYKAMSYLTTHSYEIDFVFDTGNWLVVGEDIDEAIRIMKPFTHYVHCKNVIKTSAGYQVSSSLFTGAINMEDILGHFSDVPYKALEYATTKSQLVKDRMILQRY